jgi:predicted nucleic acid-binding protein
MKRLLIDTNVYTAFKRGVPSVTDILKRAESILVSTPVLGELLCGFKCGSKERKNRDELDLFLDTPRVSVVHCDEGTAEFYAEIFRTLRSSGRPVPTNDMWIAAAAMQHGAAVCTMDSHFRDIDGLLLVIPMA